jgi:hypothetical protein
LDRFATPVCRKSCTDRVGNLTNDGRIVWATAAACRISVGEQRFKHRAPFIVNMQLPAPPSRSTTPRIIICAVARVTQRACSEVPVSLRSSPNAHPAALAGTKQLRFKMVDLNAPDCPHGGSTIA